ncbi:hypothetical protein Q4I30_001926 [Leishmania utingensis]|uniref:Uncharacterized protein n=1 Tax=Leishmania utingensis TaxID=653362 RepID=A0AAW3AW46_9TRYP
MRGHGILSALVKMFNTRGLDVMHTALGGPLALRRCFLQQILNPSNRKILSSTPTLSALQDHKSIDLSATSVNSIDVLDAVTAREYVALHGCNRHHPTVL